MRSYLIFYLILSFTLSFHRSYSQGCALKDTIRYRISMKQNRRVTIWPQPENISESASVVKEFDLNGDGKNELLIDLGVCGNSVCVSAVYSPGEDGTYSCILEPDYRWRVEAGAIQTNGWNNLLVYDEPYYRFAGQEGGLTMVEFIEPLPHYYAFNNASFVKAETLPLSSQL